MAVRRKTAPREALARELKEARAQQAATAAILKALSASSSDPGRVFNAILVSATRLCDAHLAVLNLYEGEMLRTVAHRGGSTVFAKWLYARGAFKPPHGLKRMIRNRTPVQYPDLMQSPEYRAGIVHAVKFVKLGRARTYVTVPLVQGRQVLGAFAVFRPEVRPFSARQIELLKGFAAQAVIAIENARRFNEAKSSLARQTASSNILRVLGGSMTDTQPVFDAIVKNCHQLFKDSGVVLRLAADGQLHVKASVGLTGEAVPIDRKSAIGACVVDGRTLHFPSLDEAAKKFPRIRRLGLKYGFHSGIYAPLIHNRKAIGAMAVLRREHGAFDDKDVQLFNTFAGQAVIAIENVRLFNETKEALERQTATAEILNVISRSNMDTKPVFDAIARAAQRVFGGLGSGNSLAEGNSARIVALTGDMPEDEARRERVMPLNRETAHARAIVDRAVVNVGDTQAPDAPKITRKTSRQLGFRAIAVAPIMTQGEAIGAIGVTRSTPGAFNPNQISLLQTFADQATIAIENVRLFNETKESLA